MGYPAAPQSLLLCNKIPVSFTTIKLLVERRNKNMAVLKRSDLIKMISKKIYGRYPQEEIYWILKGFAECLEEILKNGDTLKLSDCFTMQPKYRRERKLNNLDNETIVLPAQYPGQ